MIIGEFVDTYPPSLDGVGRVCFSYCETLNTMGHSAYYVAPHNDHDDKCYDVPFVLSSSIKLPHEAYRIGLPHLDLKYRKAIDKIPFDIVHMLSSPFVCLCYAITLERLIKKPGYGISPVFCWVTVRKKISLLQPVAHQCEKLLYEHHLD